MIICIDCGQLYDDCAPWQIRLGCTDVRCCMCEEDRCNEEDMREREKKEESNESNES